jgi:hypothetical protein
MSGENQKPYADPISTVGASLLAMDVNDNACCLEKCVAIEFIASKLAPTHTGSEPAREAVDLELSTPSPAAEPHCMT